MCVKLNCVTVLLFRPKLLSRPGEEDSDDDSEEVEGQEPSSHSPSLDQSHLSPTPTHTTENSIGEQIEGTSSLISQSKPVYQCYICGSLYCERGGEDRRVWAEVYT